MNTRFLPLLALACASLVLPCSAQVNSGSDGHDGAFNPTENVTIDMSDHPDGIYHYTSVNIPTGVTVTFRPNVKNSPVVWLMQGDCLIDGAVSVSAEPPGLSNWENRQIGGPGGYSGGNGGTSPSAGQGPGGGAAGSSDSGARVIGGNGSFASVGGAYRWGSQSIEAQAQAGDVYGNNYLIPLVGGSGGGGNRAGVGGGGGGGLLLAASGSVTINGSLDTVGSKGGWAYVAYVNYPQGGGGAGSGGGIRVIATRVLGSGSINATGGGVPAGDGWGGTWSISNAGSGRVRIDTFDNGFSGSTAGSLTTGFQPIILPAIGQGVQLFIASVAGTAVSQIPSGVVANPDVIIQAQQSNPISIAVNCANVPLNTEISVVVHPTNGADVQAAAMNNAGTLEASTATVLLNMPRGGGIIYAKCVSGVAGLGADTSSKELRTKSIAETGWTADGECFAKMEIVAALGGSQMITYITESGKCYITP